MTVRAKAWNLFVSATILMGALGSMSGKAVAKGSDHDDREGGKMAFCSETARTVLRACRAEVTDDYWIAVGNCLNVGDDDEREECRTEAKLASREGIKECAEQLEARLDVCAAVGEERYDPDFDPSNFVDPREIGSSVSPNPYLPLVVGNKWVYESTFIDEDGDEVTEVTTVEVKDETKLIEGVTCVVVNDVVEEDGEVIEDTDDWIAQDLEGNVWYCGEEVKDYETFAGDDPEKPELVAIHGSWKTGREYAKPGILMFAMPEMEVGTTYRQEVSLGDAEDVAEVLSVMGSETVPAASCSGDCVVTRDFSPLEPGVNENKYYAPGIGLILEVNPDTGVRTELVDFSP